MSGWLSEQVRGKQVLVTLGSGGVGKTTLAATLALQGALHGRRTLVLTIDPARRLATALGLESIRPEPQRVQLEGVAAVPGQRHGELWAMMLDAAHSLEQLVTRHASSPEARDRILGHRLFQHMAEALAGSHDLAALEQLYDLVQQERYDLIVLDTPPKEHAFDFLDAPGRFVALLAQARLRWLLEPMAAGRAGRVSGLKGLPARLILRTLATFTGREVLRDLASLTLALFDLGTGLQERVATVEALLASERCSFLIVTRPEPFTVAEALGQRSKLCNKLLPFAGFVVNRCHVLPEGAERPGGSGSAVAAELAAATEAAPLSVAPPELEDLLARLHRGQELVRRLWDQERAAMGPLHLPCGRSDAHRCPRGACVVGDGGVRVLRVPELNQEVHSLRQLLRFGADLLGRP